MNNPNYERESANAVLDLLSLAGGQESSEKGRSGVRPASTHQMRAIHALAQCEGMTVDGLPVEVFCQVSLHGQTAELRLPLCLPFPGRKFGGSAGCEPVRKLWTGRQGAVLPCLFYPVWKKSSVYAASRAARQGDRVRVGFFPVRTC